MPRYPQPVAFPFGEAIVKTMRLVALLLLAAPAAISAEDPAAVEPEPKKEKLICKTERGGGIGARSNAPA